MKKILVYSHDTYGLGNIRRMMAVVEYLAKEMDDVSILVLSGSPMLQAFRMAPGIDYIKLPCLTRTDDGKYSPKTLGLSHDRVLGLRADLILNTVLEFAPDVIIVDKKPLGVQNELAPTLDVIRRKANRPKLILLLREILDAPAKTIDVWSRNGYHDVIRELYDRVLVLGTQQIFDTAKEYRFPPATLEKVVYCGYIAKPPGRRGVSEIREELGVGDRKLVLVTAGGGADGFRLLAAYILGLRKKAGKGLHSLIFVGPEMDAEQQRTLRTLAADMPDLHLLEFSDDVMSYMNAADVIVSMAGYNTITEILSLEKEAVVVPRTRPVEEQWIRATRLERLGLISVIHPDQLTTGRLFAAIRVRLNGESARLCKVRPAMQALHRVAMTVNELLRYRDESGWGQLLTDGQRAPALAAATRSNVTSMRNFNAKMSTT